MTEREDAAMLFYREAVEKHRKWLQVEYAIECFIGSSPNVISK